MRLFLIGISSAKFHQATSGAGDRISEREDAPELGRSSRRLPPRPRRNRLRRGPERGDRIPLAGGYDRLQEMVADLVQRQVAVIAIPNTTGSALGRAKEAQRQRARCITAESNARGFFFWR